MPKLTPGCKKYLVKVIKVQEDPKQFAIGEIQSNSCASAYFKTGSEILFIKSEGIRVRPKLVILEEKSILATIARTENESLNDI